jgi:hypothetical protein
MRYLYYGVNKQSKIFFPPNVTEAAEFRRIIK